ncbi:hypothetical protein GS504_15795 [Rhodococcus hoagii]|nr:hypothetical protein [Prescottella equi]
MTTLGDLVQAARDSHGKRTHVKTIGLLIDAVAGLDRQRSMAAHPSARGTLSPAEAAGYVFGFDPSDVERERARVTATTDKLREANAKIAKLEARNEQLRGHLRDADQRIVNQREQLAQYNAGQSSQIRELSARLADESRRLAAAQQMLDGLRAEMPRIQVISQTTMERQAAILDKVALADRLHSLVLTAFPNRAQKVVQLDSYGAAIRQLREYADAEHAKPGAA